MEIVIDALTPGERLLELKRTNVEYSKRSARWIFYNACYGGVEGLKDGGYFVKHERESEKNYQHRLDNLYGFSYSEAIVDLLNLYLSEKGVVERSNALNSNVSWISFKRDCDLHNTTFDRFISNQQRETSIYGHVGILVDKPNVDFETKEEELIQKVYPYVSAYTPLNILDWEEGRDEYNRPFLSYLKLKEGNGVYRLWYTDRWELWEVAIDSSVGERAVMTDSGVNQLGEIPFVWFYNVKSSTNYIGTSDISTVSYIDFSIIRNLNQGEEVIDYSAFPMMRKVRESRGTDDDAGPTVVLEFDREFPESKPDWLEAKCKEPVDAILLWIDKKINEIYRTVNSGGVAATEVSKTAKSGVALSMEFRLLDRKLVRKGENVAAVKKEITRLWLKWENEEDKIKDVSYVPPTTYDVKSLSVDLENAIMGRSFINSDTFDKEVQNVMVKRILPDLPNDVQKEVEGEINNYVLPTQKQPESLDG